MKYHLFAGPVLAAIAMPAGAGEQAHTYHSEPSDADFSAAKAVSDPIMELVAAGSFDLAIAKIQESSPLLEEKQSDMAAVVAQARTGVQLYGPISQCILSSHTHTSKLRMTMRYVCQHEDLLLLWTLRTDSLPRGWSVTNVSFTDSF